MWKEYKMGIIIRQIREIDNDLHKVICRAEEYRKDAERGINVNHTCEGDMSWTKQDKINSLFEYLEDAKNDIDRLKDDVKVISHFISFHPNVGGAYSIHSFCELFRRKSFKGG